MGVIINDFEITVEQPQENAVTGPQPNEPSPSPQLKPQDIIDIIRFRYERMERIKAY
ncbi:MAG: hypothetical protein ACMUIU_01480 [bacterium]